MNRFPTGPQRNKAFMRINRAALCLCIGLVVLAGCGGSKKKPKLVVLISIDQCRYDYLDRFEPYFSEKGVRYFLEKGRWFENAEYQHATLHTACGHSIMVSGQHPKDHGIIANSWYDRSVGRKVDAVSDTGSPIVGRAHQLPYDGRSPRRFKGRTIGGALKEKYRNAKVVSLAVKGRAAILMGGPEADACYWFDPEAGQFVSSRYYMDALPAWLQSFNANRDAFERHFKKDWVKLLPDSAYPAQEPVDHYDFEYDLGTYFPHTIGGNLDSIGPDYYEAMKSSPVGIELTVALAKAAVIEEELGEDDVPDLLCVGISPTDDIGHDFGNSSAEMMDILLWTDHYLEDFLLFLDEKIGLDNVLLVLTSDHGTAPIPNPDEGRGGWWTWRGFQAFGEAVMTKRFGSPGPGETWISGVNSQTYFYLNQKALAQKGIASGKADTFLKSELLAQQGVGAVFTRTEIDSLQSVSNPDSLAASVLLSHYPERAGDVFVVLEPYFVINSSGKGANHYQPYWYNTRVPLIFAGFGVQAGRVGTVCSPADVAPTLAGILNVNFDVNGESRALDLNSGDAGKNP